MYIVGETLDDVMRDAIEGVDKHGCMNHPTKGETKELIGVLVELTNPRARLSRTETRGKPFSCLGELCWYLAGSNDEQYISYYIRAYKKHAEGGKLYGGYGPRIFGSGKSGQVRHIIEILRENRATRKAVIQLFDAEDILEPHEDVPCTCTLQFLIRQEKLHLVVYMRSNDAYLGFPHDVFSFTMLQEIVARDLNIDLGTYKHIAGSLHVYDKDRSSIHQFLDEGWQPTDRAMPPMPHGDPWPSIEKMLDEESRLRKGCLVSEYMLGELDPYWADLIRLLQIFRCYKNEDAEELSNIRGEMSSDVYDVFIVGKLEDLKSRDDAS